MDDLISREETLKAMDTWDKFGCDDNCRLIPLRGIDENSYVPYVHYEDMVKAVKGMPSAQKTGHWIDKSRGEQKNSECSECHTLFRVLIHDYPYCPCCGSRNRGNGNG